ncbi:4965_t:CDS:1 [Entrophospora sp. SA101]|nr:9140_t:CDS:1 [Entrophospora sp. SA101]CAJ0833511.1 4965_t:CDS:1 [Entrophospora sp. SA101]
MTNKENLQKELLEKVKPGVKASDLKKLKRSKSADDIPASPTSNIPLKKSHSHLEIPLANQPSLSQQVQQLKQNLLFTQNTADNYLQSLQVAQAQIIQLQEQLKTKTTKSQSSQTVGNEQEKINQLEQQILQLRLDKIKEFADYYQKKQDLETELEENINEGISEIQRLENKLLATNKKKLALQSQLSQSEIKYAQLKLKSLDNQEPTTFDY